VLDNRPTVDYNPAGVSRFPSVRTHLAGKLLSCQPKAGPIVYLLQIGGQPISQNERIVRLLLSAERSCWVRN